MYIAEISGAKLVMAINTLPKNSDALKVGDELIDDRQVRHFFTSQGNSYNHHQFATEKEAYAKAYEIAGEKELYKIKIMEV